MGAGSSSAFRIATGSHYFTRVLGVALNRMWILESHLVMRNDKGFIKQAC
jgi:hypothetical protein